MPVPKELNEDIKSIKNETRLFVKADKSTNFYKLDNTKYNQILNDNITKTYKKADKNQLNKIDAEAKAITKKLGIDDRVEITQQTFFQGGFRPRTMRGFLRERG